MRLRFVTNMLMAVAGGFIVVASQAFTSGVTAWITFGIGLGILAMLGAVQLDRSRGILQRGLDAMAGTLGIWTVIASVVFAGATVTWLSFAEALGLVGLALAGLVAHELTSERVVHTFTVEERARSERQSYSSE